MAPDWKNLANYSSKEWSQPFFCCDIHLFKVTSGLYYKHVMIVNDDSIVISDWSFKLIDNPRVVIHNLHRFIIQATDVSVIVDSGKSYWGERLSTLYLLVLTSLYQLVLILKILFSFFTKQATLMRRSTILNLPPQFVFIKIYAMFLTYSFSGACRGWIWTPELRIMGHLFYHYATTADRVFIIW
jgi:hypothetical protein